MICASSVSDAAQKETLLRPAAAAADAEPETLLRAANKPEEKENGRKTLNVAQRRIRSLLQKSFHGLEKSGIM